MIDVEYVVLEDNGNKKLICTESFPNATSRWDKEVQDYTHNKLLELDRFYNFSDYDNTPLILEIIYSNGKEIYKSDCVDLYFNL